MYVVFIFKGGGIVMRFKRDYKLRRMGEYLSFVDYFEDFKNMLTFGSIWQLVI